VVRLSRVSADGRSNGTASKIRTAIVSASAWSGGFRRTADGALPTGCSAGCRPSRSGTRSMRSTSRANI
jgi:hypothetical protein